MKQETFKCPSCGRTVYCRPLPVQYAAMTDLLAENLDEDGNQALTSTEELEEGYTAPQGYRCYWCTSCDNDTPLEKPKPAPKPEPKPTQKPMQEPKPKAKKGSFWPIAALFGFGIICLLLGHALSDDKDSKTEFFSPSSEVEGPFNFQFVKEIWETKKLTPATVRQLAPNCTVKSGRDYYIVYDGRGCISEVSHNSSGTFRYKGDEMSVVAKVKIDKSRFKMYSY